ncbi:MAG: transposase [Ferrimonas sp.]
MPRARKHQISVQNTPYYHCVSRCVRRAFLCGCDSSSGKNYEHRRAWVERRLLQLSEHFAIEICAYAIMSNHTHLVLHINSEQAQSWDVETIFYHWHQLFNGTRLSQLYYHEETRQQLTATELHQVQQLAEVYRSRLTDISWFMRSLNEYIAREANKEDGCTGRFWEGRFKSQALLDEQALLTCMAYVDLNPIRAKLAQSIERSHYTSVRRRVQAIVNKQPIARLKPFDHNQAPHQQQPLPCHLNQYLELLEYSGRVFRHDKAGAIPRQSAQLLQRLNICWAQWLELTQSFEHQFSYLAGKESSLQGCAMHKQSQRIRGRHNARRLFGGSVSHTP